MKLKQVKYNVFTSMEMRFSRRREASQPAGPCCWL